MLLIFKVKKLGCKIVTRMETELDRNLLVWSWSLSFNNQLLCLGLCLHYFIQSTQLHSEEHTVLTAFTDEETEAEIA